MTLLQEQIEQIEDDVCDYIKGKIDELESGFDVVVSGVDISIVDTTTYADSFPSFVLGNVQVSTITADEYYKDATDGNDV